ncbi:hypothetical protein CTI12_AA495330 [Artemisia annua]|uniref:S-adenosyl-L-methionine-dependent methyltransferases superfamily protein n=1 Tax=Artemisia annua TaxID=35608 RepID=A0A2U1LFU7_ARTAN|nr:hypothetical protein CTI12_AA495330 [Artemisia annua]
MEGHDARFKRIGSTLLLDEPFEWSNDSSLDFFAAAIDEDEEDTAGSSRKSGLVNPNWRHCLRLPVLLGSESSKADASLKSMDSSLDLVNILKHEIRDAQLSFRGKRVVELGCGYGVPGIFSCLKPECPLTPSRQIISPAVHFDAGEWEELAGVLSVVKNDVPEVASATTLSFSEEDFTDTYSSHDGSVTGQDSSSRRRSTRLSGSKVWERANETDIGGVYDVILMTDIPNSATSLKKAELFAYLKRSVEEGIFGASLVKEMSKITAKLLNLEVLS